LRIAKYLAQVGISSRRQAESLIAAGEVKLNGSVIKDLSTQIDPAIDQVEYRGQLLSLPDMVYILLNKPSGYICSVHDPQGRPTVLDLITDGKARLYPVGRLDFETEGLLLLTNDGNFANLMIHPRYKIAKKYLAVLKGRINHAALKKLGAGIELDDGWTLPAQVALIGQDIHFSTIQIVIKEGRKRQIRRMCSAVGFPVLQLKRIEFGFLTLLGVPSGKYRRLKPGEVKKLLALALGGTGS